MQNGVSGSPNDLSASSYRPSFHELRDAAILAAEAAGRSLLGHFRTKLDVTEKPNAGIVTNADLEAEAASVKVLKDEFPRFGILSEESPPTPSRCPGRWIIDPLDGTAGFARGLPIFSVSIAAEWEGKIVAGVVLQPVTCEIFSAIRGGGAFVNGRPIRVSSTGQLKASYLCTSLNTYRAKWFQPEMATLARVSQVATVRALGSSALDLANVAQGVFDGFWERGNAPWDIAAGILLVEEAGGSVTDLEGSPASARSLGVVAANAALHPLLLREVEPDSHVC